MFGFPESAKDWTSKDYLRLFTFIIAYIFLRPLIQKMYTKLGERQRRREQKKLQDEQIRKHKQDRIRAKLGISALEKEDFEQNMAKATTNGEGVTGRSSAMKSNLLARERAAKPASEAKTAAPIPSIEEINASSDEDVSDLLA